MWLSYLSISSGYSYRRPCVPRDLIFISVINTYISFLDTTSVSIRRSLYLEVPHNQFPRIVTRFNEQVMGPDDVN